MQLEFGILGPLEVRTDGEPVRLGGARQRALLAIFLLHPNRLLSRERLLDLLWGEETPDSAVNALQVHVSQLRRVLEPARSPGTPDTLLVNRPSGYLLAIEPTQLDVHQFESLAQQGRRALAGGDPSAAMEALHAALALWRGSALADFPDALFAVGARTRLEELRLSTLEERIQADLAIGLHAELVGELEALVLEYPLRERLAGELMLTLYRCGRQGDATQVYQDKRRRLVESLGLEPGPDLQALLVRILEQDPDLNLKSTAVPVARQKTHNLPMQLTSFIGRQQDIEALNSVLRQSRLVSLVGPAGIGKTRLALQVATHLHGAYPGGLCLVDLTPVTSGELVSQRALAALGFEEQGAASPIDTIARRLATERVLLVLDNCEHVLDAASEFALALLERCPGVTLLVTSRERLNVYGERVWRVEPLSVPLDDEPRSADALMDFEAVRLFVDRASAGERRFALTPANAAAIAQLCRRLDGLPLALELAAGSSSFATPRDLLLLSDPQTWWPGRPSRGTHPRQQTMQAALDWSYRLLSADEQLLFRRLSVFANVFTFQAVEQVCADDRLPRPQLQQVLPALVDKSLVAVHEAPDGASRYRLLYTVRQYASAKLLESGEADDLLRRHARYVWWLAAASADAVHGPDADAWMRHMEELHADLVAALAWSRDADLELFLRLAAAAALFWEDRGYLTEGRRWLDASLALAGAPGSIQAAAWQADGRLALLQNDLVSARARFEHGLAAASLAHDEVQQATMLRMLGLVAALMGDRSLASQLQQQSLAIVERLADNEELANTLNTLGQTARVLGNEHDAYAYHTRCLTVVRVLRNHRLGALANLNLGTLALRRSNLELAEDHIRASLETWSWLGGRLQASAAVAALGLVLSEQGDHERALRLVSAATAFAEQIGTRLERTARFWFGDDLPARTERIREKLGQPAATLTWDEGHRMSLEAAIAQALAREPVAV